MSGLVPLRAGSSVLVALVALASCDLYFPDHRVEVEGVVRDGAGGAVAGAEVTLRRSRLLYDTPLASTTSDAAGAYRLTHRLEGCSELFDGFRVVAERVVVSDTTRVSASVDCGDGVQTVDLAVPDLAGGHSGGFP